MYIERCCGCILQDQFTACQSLHKCNDDDTYGVSADELFTACSRATRHWVEVRGRWT